MHDDDTEMPQSVRNYEKRLYRHRQLYWRAILPSVLVIGAGYALGYLTEALLLALLGVTIVILVMLREMIDVLGYLGVQQREARSVARPCGVNSSIPMLNPGSNPSSNPKSDRGAAI